MDLQTPGVLDHPDLLDAYHAATACIGAVFDLVKLPDLLAVPAYGEMTKDSAGDPLEWALKCVTPHRIERAIDTFTPVNLELLATHPPHSPPVVFHDITESTAHVCAVRVLFGVLVALIEPTSPVRLERHENQGPRINRTPGLFLVEPLSVKGIMKRVGERSREDNLKILRELRKIATDDAMMRLHVAVDREFAAAVAARARHPEPPSYLEELADLEELIHALTHDLENDTSENVHNWDAEVVEEFRREYAPEMPKGLSPFDAWKWIDSHHRTLSPDAPRLSAVQTAIYHQLHDIATEEGHQVLYELESLATEFQGINEQAVRCRLGKLVVEFEWERVEGVRDLELSVMVSEAPPWHFRSNRSFKTVFSSKVIFEEGRFTRKLLDKIRKAALPTLYEWREAIRAKIRHDADQGEWGSNHETTALYRDDDEPQYRNTVLPILGEINGGGPTPAASSSTREPLSPHACAVYELLINLPAHRSMTGTKILDALLEQGIVIDMSTFTKRIVKELRPYGLMNKRRIGYYIPPHLRPNQ